MGMFDTVVVEGLKLKTSTQVSSFLRENNSALPSDFQTKDLENALYTYKIDKDYQLWVNTPVETGKRIPYKPFFSDWKDNRSFLERLYFKFKYRTLGNSPKTRPEITHKWRRTKKTNTIEMYSYKEINERYLDISFEVKIVEGKVKSITQTSATIESILEAKKRKARNQEFENNMKEQFVRHNEFASKWYYPILKETINPLLFFTRLAIQNICQKIINWTYRWKSL
jgi:hypothetical protein